MNYIVLVYFSLFVALSTQSRPSSSERKIPDSIFTVVAPFNIRQDKPFNVQVRGFDLKKTIRLTIVISGTSDDGEKVKLKKTATISRSSSKASVAFDTSYITIGKYSLIVESEGFTEMRTLTYIKKKYSFFVQFNKAIFLPGDLLQFRIFAVDSETKMATPKCSNVVTFTDTNRNNIMTFANVTFKKGNSFQLSEKARLGEWILRFQCDQEKIQKSFVIAEYTLPFLDAKISMQEYTPFKFGKVPITVDAKYISGFEASGTATVTIKRNGNGVFSKTLSVNSGSGTFDMDIVNDLKVTSNEITAYFEAVVVFEEKERD
ncbi:hypothetical protein ACKWTF_005836 [Chironomus riparius]